MIFFASIIPALVFLQTSCVSSISSFLTAPYTSWFPIAALAVLAFTGIVLVIYMLGPLLGDSGNIRAWSRMKFYELITSLILIIIFAAMATSICTVDPTSALGSVGLISSSCSSGTGNNIYSISLCDLYTFNTYVLNFNELLYLVQVRFSTSLSYTYTFKFNVGGNLNQESSVSYRFRSASARRSASQSAEAAAWGTSGCTRCP